MSTPAPAPTSTGSLARDPADGQPVLSAREVSVRFGGLTALAEVSLEVAPKTITGLVGPNGAGKTTMFGVLSGLLRPTHGRVFMHGDDVTHASPQQRARRGLARTFQQPELFLGLTVREHLVLAYRVRHHRQRLWRDMIDPRSLLPAPAEENRRVDALLELLELQEVAKAPVAALPLGMSRLVEVGRALATEPEVVLLDEPLSGLDLRAAENILSVFRRVVHEGDRNVSLLIVEHDVAAVLALSSKIFVLDFGELIAEGTPEEVRTDPRVRSAYLGDEDLSSGRTEIRRIGNGSAPAATSTPTAGATPAASSSRAAGATTPGVDITGATNGGGNHE